MHDVWRISLVVFFCDRSGFSSGHDGRCGKDPGGGAFPAAVRRPLLDWWDRRWVGAWKAWPPCPHTGRPDTGLPQVGLSSQCVGLFEGLHNLWQGFILFELQVRWCLQHFKLNYPCADTRSKMIYYIKRAKPLVGKVFFLAVQFSSIPNTTLQSHISITSVRNF